MPVQHHSTERPAGILDACAALLDEVGYDALSTRAVAQRAGVPIGSVHRFIGHKREMADASARRNLEHFTRQVTDRLETATGAPGQRRAMGAVLDEYLDMKRTAPGFSLVRFGHQIPVGARRTEPHHRVAGRLTDLLSRYLDRAPDEELRRGFLIVVETADALVRLAFRPEPEGGEKIIAELREVLPASPARVPDRSGNRPARLSSRGRAANRPSVPATGPCRATENEPARGSRTCIPVGMLGSSTCPCGCPAPARPCVTAAVPGRFHVPHRSSYLPSVRGHLRPDPHPRRGQGHRRPGRP
ncbi:hypothetical protein SHIRM173S_00045 [Streptomyces hirsutus]